MPKSYQMTFCQRYKDTFVSHLDTFRADIDMIIVPFTTEPSKLKRNPLVLRRTFQVDEDIQYLCLVAPQNPPS